MLNDNVCYSYVVKGGTKLGRFASIWDVVDHIKEEYPNKSTLDINPTYKFLVFLDDERNHQDVYWVDYPKYHRIHTIRTFETFKSQVVSILNLSLPEKETISMIDFSFDHDIQDFDSDGVERTGYDCVKWLCDYCMERNIDLAKLSYTVHSQNPIGKKNIESYIENCKKFQMQYGNSNNVSG